MTDFTPWERLVTTLRVTRPKRIRLRCGSQICASRLRPTPLPTPPLDLLHVERAINMVELASTRQARLILAHRIPTKWNSHSEPNRIHECSVSVGMSVRFHSERASTPVIFNVAVASLPLCSLVSVKRWALSRLEWALTGDSDIHRWTRTETREHLVRFPSELLFGLNRNRRIAHSGDAL